MPCITGYVTSCSPGSLINYLQALTLACLLMTLAGCGNRPVKVEPHEMLNATLWRQTSAEYEGNARQAYQQARLRLDQALADSQWTAALEQTGDYRDLPPAIMLDLDETVLDNSTYEVRIIRRHEKHSQENFAAWCREVIAEPTPGAKAFLEYAVSRGVTVFYYSSRVEQLRNCSARNLLKVGLPFPDDNRLLLNDGRTKSEQRSRISRDYRVLLLVGDNLDDFMDGSRNEVGDRRDLARPHAERWGRQWIILPNPVYGHWESSCYDFDYSLPRNEQLHRKLQLLRE